MASLFNPEALTWFARRTNPAVALSGRWAAPDWAKGREAASGLFGLGRDAHFLKNPPGVLPRLWERQITEALRALLMNHPGLTLARSQALFGAILGADVCRLSAVDRITADDATRMDLAVHARDEGGVPLCLVIEAKFQAELRSRQLANYRRKLLSRYPEAANRHLWVVAPRKTKQISRVMRSRGADEWQFATWRRLLLNWQRLLRDDPGPDAAALFSEIWKRAGGR